MSMYGKHPKQTFDKSGREISREPIEVRFDGEVLVGRHRDNPGKLVPRVSATQQSQVDEADLNAIIKRYGIDGALGLASQRPVGQFVDLVSAPDYKSALSIVSASREAFAELSADVRKRFNNNPAQFLEFMSDPSNAAEAVKLGLATMPAAEPAAAGGAGAAAPAGAAKPTFEGKGGEAPK